MIILQLAGLTTRSHAWNYRDHHWPKPTKQKNETCDVTDKGTLSITNDSIRRGIDKVKKTRLQKITVINSIARPSQCQIIVSRKCKLPGVNKNVWIKRKKSYLSLKAICKEYTTPINVQKGQKLQYFVIGHNHTHLQVVDWETYLIRCRVELTLVILSEIFYRLRSSLLEFT